MSTEYKQQLLLGIQSKRGQLNTILSTTVVSDVLNETKRPAKKPISSNVTENERLEQLRDQEILEKEILDLEFELHSINDQIAMEAIEKGIIL